MVKNLPVNPGEVGDTGSIPGMDDPLEEEMATPPVFLPREFHRQKSLTGFFI